MSSTTPTVSFAPVLRFAAVQRTAVIESVLDGHPTPALVLIHGPAGAGKSTVLGQISAALSASGSRVVWVRLRPDDAGRESFWERVLDVLYRAHALEGSSVLTALRAGGLLDDASIQSMLDAFAELAGPLTIALDDFHRVAAVDIELDLVELLVRAGSISLIVAGRQLGSLLKPRTTSVVSVRTFGAGDLAFTLDETAELVELHHPDADRMGIETTARAVHNRTSGWALGTMALSQTTTSDVRDHDRRDLRHFVEDYVNRLLSESTEEEQRVLLLTSVVEEISPTLASELTAVDAESVSRILEQVANGVEIQSDDSTDELWFRHHDLVRQALLSEALERLSAEEIRRARLTVIRAMEASRPILATQVAIELGDWITLEDVLRKTFARVLHTGTIGGARLLSRLPASALDERPSLRALALIEQVLHPRDPIPRIVAGLRLASGRSLDRYLRGSDLDRGLIAAIRMVVTRLLGNQSSALSYASICVDALAQLDDDQIDRYSETLSTVNNQKAATYIYSEDFDRADIAIERVLHPGAEPAIPEYAHAHALAALSAALRGDMGRTEAAVAAAEGVDLPHGWRSSLYSSNYRIAKALLLIERNSDAAALDECRRVEQFERRLESWPALAATRSLASESLLGSAEALSELERTVSAHRLGLPTIASFSRLLSDAAARLRWVTGLTVSVRAAPEGSLAMAYAYSSRGDWPRALAVAARRSPAPASDVSPPHRRPHVGHEALHARQPHHGRNEPHVAGPGTTTTRCPAPGRTRAGVRRELRSCVHAPGSDGDAAGRAAALARRASHARRHQRARHA